MSMSVTSVRLWRLRCWGRGDHVIAETSQFTVRGSLCARSRLRPEFGAQVHTLTPYCSFCSPLRGRINQSVQPWFFYQGSYGLNDLFFPVVQIQRYLEREIFFHGLAPQSHLDVQRCIKKYVTVLTRCLPIVLFSAIKEQPRLYIVCLYFWLTAFENIIQ